MSDQGSKIEKIVKDFFLSLDTPYNSSRFSPESYKAQFLPQLKATSPVIINGNPVGGKTQFQEIWLQFPLSQHSITSLDYHIIPGTGTIILNISGKVKFDEQGKTRLGETADINFNQLNVPTAPSAGLSKHLWGSWLGFNSNLVIDEQGINNANAEIINSLNWRIVYKPEQGLITI